MYRMRYISLDARRAQLEHVLGDDHGAAPAGRREGVRLALVRLPRVQVDDLVAVDLRSLASTASMRHAVDAKSSR